MSANPDLRSVFDFLNRHGFVDAASALQDDILEKGDPIPDPFCFNSSSSSSVGFVEFPQLPSPPPPVRILVGRGPRQTSQEADDSSSSSDSSSAFVSMGSAPSELVNPFGLWSNAGQFKSEDDLSERLSEFETAREYNDSEFLNDSFWYNDREGGYYKQPNFETADGTSCRSEDKFVTTIVEEEHLGRSCANLDIFSGGFHSVASLNCLDKVGCPFTSDATSVDDGKGEVGSRMADLVTNPLCDCCCSGSKEYYGLESEDVDYGRRGREELKELDIPLYGCCYELMSEDPKSLQATEVDKFPPKYVDHSSSPVSWEQNVIGYSHYDKNLSRNEQDFVSFPEKELQVLDSMVTPRGYSATNGDSPSNHKSSRSSDYSNKQNSKFSIKEDVEFQRDSDSNYWNVKKAYLTDGNGDYVRGGDGAMVGEEEDNGTVRDSEENDMARELQLYDNQEEEYEIFDLRIIHRKNRTGFEENKDLPIVMNTIIAGRYYVTEYLGSAAFSKVVQAHDLQSGVDVCLKIIKNDKDFFDQSLDEIKLLKFVNRHDPGDERHILRLYDYFYHQEHLFIVCELLRANLYEFQKFNNDSGGEVYFTLPRLQSITRQCLEALEYLHYLGIIHCDLKPENILIKSYSRCEIKVIDLGSSCFKTDNLCLYVQSRSYRAPEVILGLPYDQKIDIWSLGCILAELRSGDVLFPNDSVVMLLARMIGMLGPIDMEMLEGGQETHKYFTSDYDLCYRNEDTDQLEYIIPEKSSLEHRLDTSDIGFVEFVRELLQINPDKRPTAAEALEHWWLSHQY